MVKEYKDSDTFEVEATAVVVGIYIARFNNNKAMFTKAYLDLNLHCIILLHQ